MAIQIPQEFRGQVDKALQSPQIPFDISDSKLPVVVPPQTDIRIVKQWHREFYRIRFPVVHWLRLNRMKTNVNRLYLEAVQWFYFDPIILPAFVRLNGDTQSLSRFGIDETREITISFSIPILEDLGFNFLDVTIGDKVIFDGIEYQILQIARKSYVFNWNIPLDLVCSSRMFRLGE